MVGGFLFFPFPGWKACSPCWFLGSGIGRDILYLPLSSKGVSIKSPVFLCVRVYSSEYALLVSPLTIPSFAFEPDGLSFFAENLSEYHFWLKYSAINSKNIFLINAGMAMGRFLPL